MKPTRQLHDLGQSLWLDNITRTLLDDGTLARYCSTRHVVRQRAGRARHHRHHPGEDLACIC